MELTALDLIKPTHLAFAMIEKEGLSYWEKTSPNIYTKFREVETTFVSISSLIEKSKQSEKYTKYCAPSIWEGSPGFMSRSWVHEHSKKREYNYRFGTGLYHDSNSLLLVDDLFKWVHNFSMKVEEVRSAFDIIRELQKHKIDYTH